MELIKSAWVVIFLLFSLTLIFVWSKMYIISKKIKAIDALLTQCDSVCGTQKGENEKSAQ